MTIDDRPTIPAWVWRWTRGHYDRIAEGTEPKPYRGVAEMIYDAYVKGVLDEHDNEREGTCGMCKHAHGLAPGRIVCQQVIDDGHISSSSPVELSTSMTCPSYAARQEE